MIVTRTPFRVSFVGGGTDIPQVYRRLNMGCCVGMAIDKYMWICVNKRFDSDIRVSYSRTEITKHLDELRHDIARECLRVTETTHGIEVVSIADIPSGTGLGSSSAYTVGLLNALYTMHGCSPSPATLAREAINIELQVLGKSMGIQDMFMSAYGGLLDIHIIKGAVKYTGLEVDFNLEWILRHDVKLYYTDNYPHIAHAIIKEQIKDSETKLDDYKELASLADAFGRIVADNIPLESFASYIKEGWEIKKRLSPSITNEYIDSLIARFYESGAMAVKLCGAGASGFLLVVVPVYYHSDVALIGLRELPFRLERYGSMVTLFSQ